MSCECSNTCGTGGWNGPKPGDPSNNSILSATPAFGGIDVSWTYPTTNPSAVAYTRLYRSNSSSFSMAVKLAEVGGSFYYDKSPEATLVQYWYWIEIVSVNGTVGSLIGPATAIGKPAILTLIEQMSGQINEGLLAQTLRTEIEKITVNGLSITEEANNRIAANNAYSQLISQIQTGVIQAGTLLSQEITNRQEGDSALLRAVNVIAAANQTNSALIIEEKVARVTAIDTVTALYTTLNSQVNDPNTGLPKTRATLLNDYYTKAAADQAISSATLSLSSTFDNKLRGYTSTAELQQNYYTKADANTAISTAQTTTQATLGSQITSAQTTLQSNIDIVTGKVNSMYTVKLSANGLIGGFGLVNDGSAVVAGFDVTTFYIGNPSSSANFLKPFIVQDNRVYIADAAVYKLTFDKLTASDGTFIVQNGKIQAKYIQAEAIMSSNFSAYNWPTNGQGGYYLGPGGLLLGNQLTGGYFNVNSNGDVYAPGFSIVGGNATFSGTLKADTIETTHIKGGAVTSTYAASTQWAAAGVQVTVPEGCASVIIIGYIGEPYTETINGNGEYSYQVTHLPNGTLMFNGNNVITQAGSLVWVTSTPTPGSYYVSIIRDAWVGTLSFCVLVNKR